MSKLKFTTPKQNNNDEKNLQKNILRNYLTIQRMLLLKISLQAMVRFRTQFFTVLGFAI